MIRKTFIAALAIAAASPAFAQGGTADATETVEYSADKFKVETNRFWSNWFISVGGGGQVFFGDHDTAARSTWPWASGSPRASACASCTAD